MPESTSQPTPDPPPASANTPPTLGSFALFVLSGTGLVGIVFGLLWFLYDPRDPDSLGLPDHLAEYVVSSYAPAFVATLVGFRDAVFHLGVHVGDDPERGPVYIHKGARILYTVASIGLVAALGVLALVSTGVGDADKATKLIIAGGALWAGTLGYVFDVYFKDRYVQQRPSETPPSSTP